MGYYTNFKLLFNDKTDEGTEVVEYFESGVTLKLSVSEFKSKMPGSRSIEDFLKRIEELDKKCAKLKLDKDMIDILYMIWRGGSDSLKWYSWDDDVKNFSKLFPKVLFELRGEGEEAGDIWRAYFQNGKCQISKVTMTFDPYDPKKMEQLKMIFLAFGVIWIAVGIGLFLIYKRGRK